MAWIDAPLLGRMEIDVHPHLAQVIMSNISEILQFLSHIPKFQALNEAHIEVHKGDFKALINFLSTQILLRPQLDIRWNFLITIHRGLFLLRSHWGSAF